MFTLNHVIDSVSKAGHRHSKLTQEELNVVGFAPPQARHLLNNLCSFPGCNYLEIGSFKGASVISAAYKNLNGRFTAVDDFSEFADQPGNLKANLASYRETCQIRFVEGDCFTMDKAKLPKDVNVYFYDGNHSVESQERGITEFSDLLADRFILIVDDYSWSDPNVGTARALEKMNYNIELRLELHDDGNKQGWWNGLLILVANKRK
jgi:predicted O-methyltransferase YrrM